MSDLLFIFQWWLIWLFLGITFLPFAAHLFPSFFDKGYVFAKILGILAVSYIAWLASSLKILPFSSWGILAIYIIFVISSAIFYYRKKTVSTLRPYLKIFAIEELLFLGGFVLWAYIKSFEPSIHGLEKYMDFGFINSILRTDFFPPKDLWLTPHSINYYYFGHLTSAVLTKISGLDPAVTYNLTLAHLFALTLTASFSLGANLWHLFSPKSASWRTNYLTLLSGFLGAFLVTLGGNLHTIYAFFQNYAAENPVPFWTLPVQLNLQSYWYPNATRFIPFTIHEFPIYSFVVSDLHGHVFNIPFVLLLLALFIVIFHSQQLSVSRLNAVRLSLISLLIAVFLMTNVLDGPIYLLSIFLVLLAKERFSFSKLKLITYHLSLITFLTILFSLPYWLAFKPFGAGIGVLCAPKFLTDAGKIGPLLFEADHCARSPIWMLALLWGFFYSVVLAFSFKSLRSLKGLKLLISENLLIITFTLFATILIIIPEFFYVKDIYPAHYRANTVFKFGYQAFMILGLVSGYLLIRLIAAKKLIPLILLLPLFLLVSIYPFFAVNSYFGGLKTYKGLYGLTYLNELYPADYQAILWARDNIKGQPVILEAQGDSYTDFARVSSNTGLPTVIGWPVHEWLWRGSYDEAGKRVSDVSLLYESQDQELTKNLLKKYNAEYVFIGALERQKYLNLNEAKFESLGKVIFSSGQTKIYQLTK
ncbi:hypothetical protein A2617_03660 [Candidatus Daviesbacteria bacterium RIFOXYD1_FULL_41_10]|uniref:YYY membrane protein n=1 Tax=Candidatus Daviesbacteria bacterium RIFOXYD1_FULL_41_10 TaxID=1797801 RepID=A0A1F5N0V3_9BACT|nr:MAG: hypothetical protein A2617_03660 [Candidatus Daviesbacteria bacterium RIFOXYD1_FULL_41_10]